MFLKIYNPNKILGLTNLKRAGPLIELTTTSLKITRLNHQPIIMLVSQVSIKLQSTPIRQAPFPRYSKFIYKTVGEWNELKSSK